MASHMAEPSKPRTETQTIGDQPTSQPDISDLKSSREACKQELAELEARQGELKALQEKLRETKAERSAVTEVLNEAYRSRS